MLQESSKSAGRWLRHVVAVSAAMGSASLARGADAPAAVARSELKLTTEKVIVFKDGYNLIIKRAVGTTDARGEVHTDQVPDAAVLGTFWAVSKQARLLNMNAGWTTAKDKLERPIQCTQHIEILDANRGKQCKVILGDKSSHDGIIQEVLTQATETPLAIELREALGVPISSDLAAALAAGTPAAATDAAVISGVTGSMFVLRTEQGDLLLPVAQIQSLLIKDMHTSAKRLVTTTKRTKRLTFRFEKPEQEQDLLIMHFGPGLRWIPTYRIDLESQAVTPDEKAKAEPKTAAIALQAEILNEAEDLADVPVDIVVGVPNFRFRGIISPFSLEQALRNALEQSAPQLMGQFRNDFSNSAYAQRSSEFRRDAAQAAGAAQAGTIELPDELTATGAQDLFVYNLPKLRLKKGERAAVPIFTARVPYRDVYTWDLSVKRSDIDTAPSGSGVQSPLVLSTNQVWHQIELTNTTRLPWTTGAAMIMQGNQPLAQELLTYTSPKDQARVPVTVSVETRGSFSEQETSRELQSIQWDGYHYAKIGKRAALDLCNNRPETIEVDITLKVGGRVTAASDDGQVTLGAFEAGDWDQYRGSPAVNNSSLVRWKVKLKSGEKFQPTVDYHYFTRH